jgi:hypothetical protein
MMSPLVLILTIIVVLCSSPDPVIGQITSGLQSILKNTHLSRDYGYPTDITRDLLPVSTLCGPVQRIILIRVCRSAFYRGTLN